MSHEERVFIKARKDFFRFILANSALKEYKRLQRQEAVLAERSVEGLVVRILWFLKKLETQERTHRRSHGN